MIFVIMSLVDYISFFCTSFEDFGQEVLSVLGIVYFKTVTGPSENVVVAKII